MHHSSTYPHARMYRRGGGGGVQKGGGIAIATPTPQTELTCHMRRGHCKGAYTNTSEALAGATAYRFTAKPKWHSHTHPHHRADRVQTMTTHFLDLALYGPLVTIPLWTTRAGLTLRDD